MKRRRFRIMPLDVPVAPLESVEYIATCVFGVSRSTGYRMRDRGELAMTGGHVNVTAECARYGWTLEPIPEES